VTDPVPTVFFGSGEFAVPILEALLAAPEVVIRGVVTTPDRPAGRRAVPTSTPVAERARALGIALLQPAGLRNPEAVAAIAALGAGLGVLADYGRIVPAPILELPAVGILNLHPSLLPRWRGASPIPVTIVAGDRETGVSVIRMDAGLDTGPIVAVERWALGGDEDAPRLEAFAATVAAGLIGRVVGPWLRGEIEPRPQEADGVTMTRPLRREDGRLDPSRPATELERQVRAFRPWPGTFIETVAGRIAVLEARVQVGTAGAGADPGRLGPDGLTTADGSLLALDIVQPAGGRAMSWAELLRGRPGLIGSVVNASPA
jgi:methionyl-tRNA formyltransferase